MASIDEIKMILKQNKDEIVSELGYKLMPMQQDILLLQETVHNLETRVHKLESQESRPIRENNPSQPNQPTHRTNNQAIDEIEAAQRKLGFYPISAAEMETTTVIDSVKNFMKSYLRMPSFIVNNMRMKSVLIRPTREKDEFTVFMEFESVADVLTITRYLRNLPRECRTLLFIPTSLITIHRNLEEQAFQLRHQVNPKKTLIKWFNNTLALFIKDANNKWIPIVHPTRNLPLPTNNLPETNTTQPMTQLTSTHHHASATPQSYLIQEYVHPAEYQNHQTNFSSNPVLTQTLPNPILQIPTVPQPSGYTYNNHTLVTSPPTFTTLMSVPSTFSHPNPLPSPPELQDTDGNLFNRQGSATQMINYWNQNQNQGNML